MTGLVFLADSLDITNRHINASASQHIQPDGNLAFAIDIDQFTNQPGQRSFHNTDLLTTCQRRAVHTNSFLGIVEHETETSHLLIWNHRRRALTTHHHITAHCRKTQNFFAFFRIYVHKHHHWKKDRLNYLAPVTPLMNFLLDRDEILDPHFV